MPKDAGPRVCNMVGWFQVRDISVVGSGSSVDVQVFFRNAVGVKGDLSSPQEILEI